MDSKFQLCAMSLGKSDQRLIRSRCERVTITHSHPHLHLHLHLHLRLRLRLHSHPILISLVIRKILLSQSMRIADDLYRRVAGTAKYFYQPLASCVLMVFNCAHYLFGVQTFLQTSLNKSVEKIIGATQSCKSTTRYAASAASVPLRNTSRFQSYERRLLDKRGREQNSIVRSSSRRLDGSRHFGRVGYVVSINS